MTFTELRLPLCAFLRFKCEVHCLVLAQFTALPEPLEYVHSELAPQRCLNDFSLALACPGSSNLDSLENLSADS